MPACLPNPDQLPDIELSSIEPIVLRAPIENPVITSFGTIRERTALLVRVEDRSGAVGWGEIFGNFPLHGAENRAHLVRDYVAPVALSETWASPAAAFEAMTARTHILAIQCGEPGPFAQAIAGVDQALWDLTARKLGQPLWRLFGEAGASPSMPAYASGLNPRGFEAIVERKLAEGYLAFKIKIGFGREADLAALDGLRGMFGASSTIMTDVNQGWDVATASANWAEYSERGLAWIEEPLPADRPIGEWMEIAALGGAPVAAGENLRGQQQFDDYLASGVCGVLQPDLAKWGGFTRTVPLAAQIVAHGTSYCPHFLAGAIGLYASAHCLAAVGGAGLLEVDANTSPLRETLAGPLPVLSGGRFALTDAPGLGVEPLPEQLEKFARLV